MKFKFVFAWYDLWVGAFIDRPKRRLYLFPVPCFGAYIEFLTATDWLAWKLKWLPVQNIRDDNNDIVLTRVKLMPATSWGQLYFHIFRASEHNMPMHDHPYDFKTFPFRDYVEHTTLLGPPYDMRRVVNIVRAWQLRSVPAEYVHVVVGPLRGTFPFYTLFWQGPQRRKWGFWHADGPGNPGMWEYWKDYYRRIRL